MPVGGQVCRRAVRFYCASGFIAVVLRIPARWGSLGVKWGWANLPNYYIRFATVLFSLDAAELAFQYSSFLSVCTRLNPNPNLNALNGSAECC